MNLLKHILKISRPRFWFYLAGPYLFGYTFGYNHQTPFLTIESIYTFFFFLIPANIFIYGVNDYYDKETDSFNLKKNTHESKITDKNSRHYSLAVIISALFFIPLFFFVPTITIPSIIFFAFLSFFYSAPPLRFKAHLFLDSSSNILYAIPGFIGYSQLTGQLPPLVVIVIALCWTAAMHLYSAIPDIQSDKKAHIKTTAVTLGKDQSLIVCLILWTIVTIISSTYSLLFILLAIYPLMIMAVMKNFISLESLYWKFPYINTILGFLLYVYAYNS